MALWSAADFRLARGDTQLSRELAEQAITLATEQGLPSYVVLGECVRGSALIAQGRAQEGIASLRRGIDAAKILGISFLLPQYLMRLGQAYASLGQSEAAVAALSEALAERASMGKHYDHDAELYRVKGELTLQSQAILRQISDKSQISQDKSENTNPKALTSNTQAEVEREAEECFLKAIEIAQKQQAKSLELRATMSLAHLWQQQGKRSEAHKLLVDVYNWFTEGFDTKDLQEAKVLLEELA